MIFNDPVDHSKAIFEKADYIIRQRCAVAGVDLSSETSTIPIEPKLLQEMLNALAWHHGEYDNYADERSAP